MVRLGQVFVAVVFALALGVAIAGAGALVVLCVLGGPGQ